jgi:hypothetical protein
METVREFAFHRKEKTLPEGHPGFFLNYGAGTDTPKGAGACKN